MHTIKNCMQTFLKQGNSDTIYKRRYALVSGSYNQLLNSMVWTVVTDFCKYCQSYSQCLCTVFSFSDLFSFKLKTDVLIILLRFDVLIFTNLMLTLKKYLRKSIGYSASRLRVMGRKIFNSLYNYLNV